MFVASIKDIFNLFLDEIEDHEFTGLSSLHQQPSLANVEKVLDIEDVNIPMDEEDDN